MKKRTLIVMLAGFFLLILHPGVILAHSSLVSTVPNDKSTSEVTEITMNFNEALDSSAKVTVTNAAGEEQALKETQIKGKVVTATLEKPLSDGSYKVDWRIISADGHPGKGSFSFLVEVPAPATTPAAPTASATNPPASSSTSTPSDSPVSSASPSAPAPSSEAPAADTASDANGGMDFSTWALIGAAVILLAAVIVAYRKRK